VTEQYPNFNILFDPGSDQFSTLLFVCSFHHHSEWRVNCKPQLFQVFHVVVWISGSNLERVRGQLASTLSCVQSKMQLTLSKSNNITARNIFAPVKFPNQVKVQLINCCSYAVA